MLNTIEIKIFVSCPGDVTPEKEMVKAVCASLNNVYADPESPGPYRFNVLDWRDITAAHNSGRPQGTINIRFDGYNIYFGILWMRFGSPTGAVDPVTGEEYQSGTLEEFRLAHERFALGNELGMFMFFKDPKVVKGIEETEQWLNVQKFQKEIRSTGWIHQIPNKEESPEFNNLVHEILVKHIRVLESAEQTVSLSEYKHSIEAFAPANSAIPAKLISLIKDAPVVNLFIPRTLTANGIRKDPIFLFTRDTSGQKLNEIVNEQKRVVVLGNAGSGKSVELGGLARHFLQEDALFVPVYKRLNTYVDEPISTFLPDGWTNIPEDIALIILDGLDEIQPQHFHTAIRRLSTFSDEHPSIRIVISCRTNFYSLPDKNSSGTLSGFEVYHINEIQGRELQEYLRKAYQIDPETFIRTAHREGYGDLIWQPFFMHLLVEEFIAKKNLRGGKAALLNDFLQKRIALDQAHFANTVNLKEKKAEASRLLQRIALTMEYLGRNYVSGEELLEIVPQSEDLVLVKQCTAFNRSDEFGERWSFEHNNIQEYLAARALKDLTLKQIKSFLSFNSQKIKPSWVNTLFFLMSIISERKRSALIQWIVEIEPEVLVRIEPDKVDEQTRFAIFKKIFEDYQQKEVWLRSNKFSDQEFARFPPVKFAFPFVSEILNSDNYSRIVKLNALTILQYLLLDAEQLEQAKNTILNYLEANIDDVHLFYSVSSALNRLELTSVEIIERLMQQFGERSNQYIRAGFYSMINHAGLTAQYFDYFLDGINHSEEDKTDRDKVHLMDESTLLRKGLMKVTDYNSLKKLFEYFDNPFDRTHDRYYDKNDVLKNAVERAIELYPSEPAVINIVYHIFKGYGRISEETYVVLFTRFFVETNTEMTAFQRLLKETKIESYEKGLLMTALLKKETTDHLLLQYELHEVTNEQILEFYNYTLWHQNRLEKKAEVAYLLSEIQTKTHILDNIPQIDHNQLRRERQQREFDLYFEHERFKEKLREFFSNAAISEISWEEIWTYYRDSYSGQEKLSETIFELLVEFTRDDAVVTLNELLAFTNDQVKFEQYLINRIYHKLKGFHELQVSQSQIDVLQDWVNRNSAKINTKEALLNDEDYDLEDPIAPPLNYQVPIIWYLINRLNLDLSIDKVLDFSLINEEKTNMDQGLDFSLIENRTGKTAVQNRVIQNLKEGIRYDTSWRNNALYALDNGLTAVYPLLLKEVAAGQKSEHSRRIVLKHYDQVNNDSHALVALLKILGRDELRWDIVSLLRPDISVQVELEAYLRQIMNSKTENINAQIAAARYLIENNDPEAFDFFAEHLLNAANPHYDYYHNAMVLKIVQNIAFVPKMMSLLAMGKRSEFLKDDFNRLDNSVLEGLQNIALVSLENLKIVTAALKDFIQANLGQVKDINFLYPWIERMEYQFYLNGSKGLNIEDALAEINLISSGHADH